ncbi:MAG: F0F1 ATP synthase subunit A [Firmicutes bacterium]|nr:F0F1 ATP synthase subunit A [Bacillota bacterium]MBR0523199.1 F0F1 ATP synthase subunit A [Bacillota bacterium]
MNIDIKGAPVYFEIPILGGIPISATLVVTWIVMIVLTGLCAWMTHGMTVRNVSKKQAAAEKLVAMAEGLVNSNMGEGWGKYVPFVATLFALSIVSSLSSLLGLWAPTADLATELAWSVVVFIIITYYKITSHGLGSYLKSFLDPVFVMAPFNVLGELFKPISMAFRHFGNIVSGVVINALIYSALVVVNHAVFGLIPGLVGKWLSAIPFFTVGLPAVVSLYFDWFTSLMQAYIFCMLTMIFISTATE